ncbi:FMN-dependent NADH-azoreductase [Vagococcus humatus]|uniref:FMN dependent NADH:quinone oxidoreductase n=1 Tax=Vagococcus humatus TaxID=1889241 RepID=A0A429Z6A8_9ENTE|nr:FMN-dependent NADH-azoreductase [Vagococcus humatus]RST89199.1 FMN-dependent NADH-azoreductase [Vagococcus humatus]
MTTVLVVKGHPLTKENSRTLKTLDTFLTHYQQNNPEDTIEWLDLYQTDIPEIEEVFLGARKKLMQGTSLEELSEKEQEIMAQSTTLLNQFLKADKIILANPLWNLTIPSRVKDWFDAIYVTGKTFKYTENGPVGISDIKKSLHIQSNGGIYQGQDFGSSYVKASFAFMGIPEHHQLFIEGIDYTPDQETTILANAQEEAKKLAKIF